uniref:Uncharacterized protein n=1 Tax=Kalanchoe fedtschenkoi TaxID=63787 RepID=A0A7N0USZ0_KALFE
MTPEELHQFIMELSLIDFTLGVATALGLISLSKLIFGAVRFVWSNSLRPPKDLAKTYGSWALITGGANGIGQALSFQLASKGLNLIILDRDQAQLETATKMLHEEFGTRVEVRGIAVDLNRLKKDDIIKAIREGIEGLDVGILINNAGVAYMYPTFLHEVTPDVVESLLNVNAGAATWATMAVLPSMMRRKRGAIVNIGSASAHVLDAYPLVSIYGATKAYVEHFSKSTSVEYKRYGIDVQCQAPIFVATKMTRRRKGSLLVPTPKTWSEASVRWIGYDEVCVPYWPHYVLSLMGKFLPSLILNWYFMRLNLHLRDLYSKKVNGASRAEDSKKNP